MPEPKSNAKQIRDPCFDESLIDQALIERGRRGALDEGAAVHIDASLQDVAHRFLGSGGVVVRTEHPRVRIAVTGNVAIKVPVAARHRR